MRQDRLDKLFTFLLELPEEQFDFAQWARNPDEEESKCGTICCAGGWMPAVDPEHWVWKPGIAGDWALTPLLVESQSPAHNVTGQLAEYFDFDIDTAEALFMPSTVPGEVEDCANYEEPSVYCEIPTEEYYAMTPKLWVERAKRILAKVPSEAQ